MSVSPLSDLAESYVKLVLAVGQHDPDYVDAYYGPQGWRPAEGAAPRPLSHLRDEAGRLLNGISAAPPASDAMDLLRREYLARQLQAVDARLRMLAGERFTF